MKEHISDSMHMPTVGIAAASAVVAEDQRLEVVEGVGLHQRLEVVEGLEGQGQQEVHSASEDCHV